MMFKTSHNDDIFKRSDFLKKKFKQDIKGGKVKPSVSVYPGVDEKRKEGIIKNLIPKMPVEYQEFWHNL